MGADVLATQWARASATVIYTLLRRIYSAPARQILRCIIAKEYREYDYGKL